MNTESEFTKGQEVWVKATIEDKSIHKDNSWFVFVKGGDFAHVPEDGIRTTEQIILENTTMDSPTMYRFFDPVYGAENAKIASRNAEQNAKPTTISNTETVTEYDRTRRFKKGDKVRLVERWGRPPREEGLFESWAFEPNKVYEVLKDEEYNEVELTNGEYSWDYPFYFLDLVEPAPEPKYWLHESPKTYSIYYKGQFGRVITAMLMQKELYTLEEAQEQCDKLNQK